MKKRLVVLLMLLMCFMFATTACTSDTESKSKSSKNSEKEVDDDDEDDDDDKDSKKKKKDKDDKKDKKDKKDKDSDDADDDSDDDDADADKDDADDEKPGKDTSAKYTAETLADAYLIDNVKYTVEVADGYATFIITGSDFMMEVSADDVYMEMYAIDKVLYMHMVGEGEDMWVKSSSMTEDIDDLIEEIGAISMSDSFTNVEYVETVKENGVSYDVVKATEIRDGEEFQDLTFYVNVKTGLVEKSESESDGELVTVYYEQCNSITLPKEAANATEI